MRRANLNHYWNDQLHWCWAACLSLVFAGLVVAMPALAQSEAQARSEALAQAEQTPQQVEHFTSAQLSNATDQQLTALAASWGKLDPGQRRVLLAEMRTRMSRSQNDAKLFRRNDAKPQQRQYGRVIREVRKTRQPDGSILVETRVVRVRPKSETTPVGTESQPSQQTPGRRVTFGIGFERRQQQPQPVTPVQNSSAEPQDSSP